MNIELIEALKDLEKERGIEMDVLIEAIEAALISAYKKPRYYRFIDALPMTATGKKMHYKVREMALEDLKNGKLKRL